MDLKGKLKPEPLWLYFEEICKIPRISKNEEKIRKFLLDFAFSNKLWAKEDQTGNILIIRPASPGFENKKTVVLQSHMDMVGEKNADHPHDWSKDPIVPLTDGEWVYTVGTTLGADDGIGIAAQMAILIDKTLKAGPIECLFTVDEESGMTGALNLQPDFFKGRILLNLDSEDEGILFIGCAGGMDTIGTMDVKMVPSPGFGATSIEISVTGLHGGHSGDEIHKGYGNSVKIMNRILWNLANNYNISLAKIDGGNLRNAIPREAFSTIVFDNSIKDQITDFIVKFSNILAEEFSDLEPLLKISFKETLVPGTVMEAEGQKKLINALACCPHGAIAWSKDMDNLVETSTNLASVKSDLKGTVKIITTQRSSIESSKHDVSAMVESCLHLAGAEVVHSDGYPGWKPNMNSEILGIMRDSYTKLFGKEPLVRAIHAGLECGLIYEKIRRIDMISFGPTIRGAHTPEEKIEIKTVQMFWDLLIDVLGRIPEN